MDGLLILCLALLLLAAGLKLKTVTDLRRIGTQCAESLQERQRLHDGRAQLQARAERLELQERELTNDVRDLVRELADLDGKIARLQSDLTEGEER